MPLLPLCRSDWRAGPCPQPTLRLIDGWMVGRDKRIVQQTLLDCMACRKEGRGRPLRAAPLVMALLKRLTQLSPVNLSNSKQAVVTCCGLAELPEITQQRCSSSKLKAIPATTWRSNDRMSWQAHGLPMLSRVTAANDSLMDFLQRMR
jgi:hypothetical protein